MRRDTASGPASRPPPAPGCPLCRVGVFHDLVLGPTPSPHLGDKKEAELVSGDSLPGPSSQTVSTSHGSRVAGGQPRTSWGSVVGPGGEAGCALACGRGCSLDPLCASSCWEC